MNKLIIIFTDLDGTFLDHNNYGFSPAIPCLEYIKKENIPLIFTSSKTTVEIQTLCAEMNLYHPYISENGGLLSIPKNYFYSASLNSIEYDHELVGISRRIINQILDPLHRKYKFLSFSEMTVDEIAKLTGLNTESALMANQRTCSEPIHWQDNSENLRLFSKSIDEKNLQVTSGGRFHHVMGKHDKASTMLKLIQCFKAKHNNKITVIALGDSPNDYKMLSTADYGILIPNPNAPKQCLDKPKNLIYAKHVGPQGWNESLLQLLEELHA